MGGSDHCYFFGFSSDRNVFTANINDINLVETRTVLVLANFGCLPFAKSFGKSGGKVIGTRLFGWIQRKICWAMELLKSIPVFPEGMLQTEIRVPLLRFKVFRPAWKFFGKWNWFHCTHGKGDSGTKLTSLEFCLPLVRTWSHWFAHVNGEQLLSLVGPLQYHVKLLLLPRS